MAQGIALLVGIKDASTGGLGCERDVDRMAQLLSKAGNFTINMLKTELATADAIKECIESAASTLVAGDMFVFYFAGHGGQRTAANPNEEDDGQDEVLFAYASQIVDNELAECWKGFASGVRIVMVSDCCHSGTNEKLVVMDAAQDAAPKARNPIKFAAKASGAYLEWRPN